MAIVVGLDVHRSQITYDALNAALDASAARRRLGGRRLRIGRI